MFHVFLTRESMVDCQKCISRFSLYSATAHKSTLKRFVRMAAPALGYNEFKRFLVPVYRILF